MNAVVGDLAGNARQIIDFTEDARQKKADLVVFPELALCGYPPEDLLLKKHFVDNTIKKIKARENFLPGFICVASGFRLASSRFGNVQNGEARRNREQIRHS